MTDAPERIWAYYSTVFGAAWSSCTDDGATEYLRADIAAARVEALQAEVARLRGRLERGMAACDQFDATVSRSQFVNGQATCAQQISAAMEATDGQ